jgi:uncharacterized protein
MTDIMTTLPEIYQGSAGPIETLVDYPEQQELAGIAIITHPHPLQGGTAGHKIPQALARCFQQLGWLAVRPNFRGAGKSAGVHDRGVGETSDILLIVEALRQLHPHAPLALAGFSFGAFVQACVANQLMAAGNTPQFTILAGTPFGTIDGSRVYETPVCPQNALIIHGSDDAIAPLANVFQWAEPQHLPVIVFPGANHFLTGYLERFINLIATHITAQR